MTIYTHDCDTCDFLGTILDDKFGMCDVYVCPLHDEIIARWGDSGEQYSCIDRESLVLCGHSSLWAAVGALLIQKELES